MPRYTVRLSSSKHGELRRCQDVWGKDDTGAVTFAADALRRQRITHHRGDDWDRWAVFSRVYPYPTPRLIAQGQMAGD